MNAIEIKELTKKYPGFTLDKVSLCLPGGCILGLIGENGAGKSTMIKLILNTVQKDGGSVTVLGRDNESGMELTKEEIGVVPDEIGLPDCLNAVQVGKIMAGIFRNWDGTEYERLLQKLAVPDGKKFRDYSRGMRMKLGIAIALSHGSRLLLLDEATSGLDPVVRDEVLGLFEDFTRDETHSILISSHIVSELERVCDYIAFLHRGKLLLCEEKDRLHEEYGKVFGTAAELAALPEGAVCFRKNSGYGWEAIVKRKLLPENLPVSDVDIEELFVFTVKGEEEG